MSKIIQAPSVGRRRGSAATPDASTELIDLGRYREQKHSVRLARRKQASTSIHLEISASGEVTSVIPAVDPRDAIAVIAWCTELASQMFDVYYASPRKSLASKDVCGKLLSMRDRLESEAPREN